MSAAHEVKLVRDANGAHCPSCGACFDECNSWPWGWRKSQSLHERGTGHRMRLFALPSETAAQ